MRPHPDLRVGLVGAAGLQIAYAGRIIASGDSDHWPVVYPRNKRLTAPREAHIGAPDKDGVLRFVSARRIAGVACVNNNIHKSACPSLAANNGDEGVQFVVDNMILPLIYIGHVSLPRVIWHNGLVPSVRLVAIGILDGLPVTREMDVHQVALAGLLPEAAQSSSYGLCGSLPVGQHCDAEVLLPERTAYDGCVICSVNVLPAERRLPVRGVLRQPDDQRPLHTGAGGLDTEEAQGNYEHQQLSHSGIVLL